MGRNGRGRQPWIIYGVMRTREAVTPIPGLVVPFVIFTSVYFFLANCRCGPPARVL